MKILFVYKHLPLNFHPFAMPAAKRFEAIVLQSAKKAFKFHDEIFENQDKLKSLLGNKSQEVLTEAEILQKTKEDKK